MQIWVDADACPGEIKELLFRAAKRTRTKVTLVANQALRTPRSEFIDSLLVPAGMNVADRRIVEMVEPGDLVITADIPLAAEVVEPIRLLPQQCMATVPSFRRSPRATTEPHLLQSLINRLQRCHSEVGNLQQSLRRAGE